MRPSDCCVCAARMLDAWLTHEPRPRLHDYLAEVARSKGCLAYRVGGVADHVHLALTLPRTMTQSDLVK